MSPGDILWSVLLVAVLATGLGWLLVRAPGRRWTEGVGVAALLAAALSCYLTPGDIPQGDGHSHLARTWLWLDLVRGGELPIWTWSWYAGYPFARLYGFLYYAMSAAVADVAGLAWGTKLTLWSLHVTSGLALWWAARTMEPRPGTGSSFRLIAGVTYALSFQHVGAITAAGALPLALVYPLAPLPYGLVMLALTGRLGTRAAGAGIGLALAATCWTHLQYGLLVLAAFAAWAAITGWKCEPARRRRMGAVLGVAAGTTIVLIAWQVSGWLAWSDELMVVPWSEACAAAPPALMGHLLQLVNLVRWSRGFDDWALHYVGLTVLGLAVVGVLAVLLPSTPSVEARECEIRGRAGHLGLQAAAWMTTVGLVGMVVAPRVSHAWLLPVCLTAGWGANRTLQFASSRFGIVWPALGLAVLLAVDLGPTLQRQPFDPSDTEAVAELRRAVDDRHLPRVLVLGTGTTAFWRGMDIVDTGATTPFGAIPQLSTRSLESVAVVAFDARTHLETAALENSATDASPRDLEHELLLALSLMGIQGVLVPGTGLRILSPCPLAMYAPEASRVPRQELANEQRIDWRAIRRAFGPDGVADDLDRARVAEIIALCDPDLRTGTLQLILLDDPAGSADWAAGRNLDIQRTRPESFQLMSLHQQHTRVRLRYRAEQAGWVRLAFAHFPTHLAEVDGRTTRCARTALGMTAIPVPAGEHTVALRASFALWEWLLVLLASIGALTAGVVTIVGLFRAGHRGYNSREEARTPTENKEVQ